MTAFENDMRTSHLSIFVFAELTIFMPRGLLWRWIFARSFALINMDEDSPAVSGRWSSLSQSEDFSALLAEYVVPKTEKITKLR